MADSNRIHDTSAAKNIDSETNTGNKERARGIYSAYNAISGIFISLHRVNVKENILDNIKISIAEEEYCSQGSEEYDTTVEQVVRGLSSESSRGEVLQFVNRHNLPARMANEDHIFLEFLSCTGELCRLHFFKEDEDEDGSLLHAILGIEKVSEEKSQALISALSHDFQNVFWVDLGDGSAHVLKMSTYIGENVDEGSNRCFSYSPVCREYIEKFIYPEDRDRISEDISLEHLRDVFHEKDELAGTYRIEKDDGIHHYRYVFYSLPNMNSVVAGFRNIDDVIARHTQEEKAKHELEVAYRNQLEEQLTVFNTLARNFKNIYYVDLERGTAKVLKLDPAYTDILGIKINDEFPFDSVLKGWLNMVVCDEDREDVTRMLETENVKNIISRQNEFTGTYRSIVGGKMHHFQYSVVRADEAGTRVILGFQNIDDIINAHLKEETARREKEEIYQKQLLNAAKEAERANKAKTEFLLRMSHDIRTPINGIIGMLDIADHYDQDIEKQRECRIKTRESSKILLDLINEVLDMSKLESGEVMLENVPFDLNTMAYEIFTIIERQAQERGLEIIEEDCNVTHAWLIGSPVHYRRLVLNILGNAIKYNRPYGRIYITCREISFDGTTVMLETKIQDTGIGMSEEFQKHLFEPFSQENASARTKYGGTGLGMSITKSLVEKMGGTITFESQKDVGTTFDVIIPFKADLSYGMQNAPQEEDEDDSIRGETLLVAEDNELNLEITKFILEEAGAHVITANNGQEAAVSFAASKPGEISAILMDLMMPVMDGYKAAGCIRAMDRADAASVPIIAMTANAFVEDRIATRNAGMNEHIAKPLEAKKTVHIISQQIRARKNKGE